MVARNGWKLLPLYRFNNETGDWYHAANTKFRDRRWLQQARNGGGTPPQKYARVVGPSAATLKTDQLFSIGIVNSRREISLYIIFCYWPNLKQKEIRNNHSAIL